MKDGEGVDPMDFRGGDGERPSSAKAAAEPATASDAAEPPSATITHVPYLHPSMHCPPFGMVSFRISYPSLRKSRVPVLLFRLTLAKITVHRILPMME